MASLRISLRAGERIFVNGAVLKVDRKTSLEFLNDVTFLLESHVMQTHEAKTPLRQLYFIVQMILIDPANAAAAHEMFAKTHRLLLASFSNAEVLAGLAEIGDMVGRDRPYDALKKLRSLIPLEDAILAGGRVKTTVETSEPPVLAAGGRR